MSAEAKEHRERLKILEKHIGEYYYMISNIHNGISDAMESYAREYHAKEMERKLEEAENEIEKEFAVPPKEEVFKMALGSPELAYELGKESSHKEKGAKWLLTHLKEQKQDKG